jgi:uncharacterized protein (DUF362 family)
MAAAQLPPLRAPNATVAITRCRGYGPPMRAALDKGFDLLGGIGRLVKDKTVTVKINLTGSDYRRFQRFLDRPVGETYMTHPLTAQALAAALFAAGARRVRFVESTNLRQPLADTLAERGWDVPALLALGRVEFEDTRNLGLGKTYTTFKVPGGGRLFSSFELNHSYADTDVMVSLCKLKLHITTGVTMTMKNLFGITPNALYGDESPDENALPGRGRLHDPFNSELPPRQNPSPYAPPGATARFLDAQDGTHRVPRIITDICAARPIHLGVIDGITAMSGGEGPWTGHPFSVTTPGVIIAGFDPVATDTVGTAVMGFDNPRAKRGAVPFEMCDNHLLLAEEAKLGSADLARIEVAGVPVAAARCAQYKL